MRAAAYAHMRGRGREFALAALRLQFRDGRPLSEPAAVAEAADRAGLDGEEALAATADAEVKQRLREWTEEALAAGVIGVPSLVVAGAVYWGDDRLEDAAAGARA